MQLIRRLLFGEEPGAWWLLAGLVLIAVLTPLITLRLPLVEKQLIDAVILGQRLSLLPPLLTLYVGLWLGSTCLSTSGRLLQKYFAERLTKRLQERLFAHVEMLSLAFSRQEHSGRTLSLFVNDIPNLTSLLGNGLLGILGNVVTLVLALAFMFSLNWQLAVTSGILPPLVVVCLWFATRPLRPAMRRAQAKAAEVNERLHEGLAGLRELVTFGEENRQRRDLSRSLGDLLRLRMRIAMLETGLGTGQLVLSLAVSAIILGYGGYLVIRSETTLGTLIAMRSLFGYAFTPASQIFGLVGTLQKARGTADRLQSFLDQTPRVPESPDARWPSNVEGRIEFQGVGFAYTSDHPVLQDISFTAWPGQMIALVGPSGAGKTTIASLICRFYDPTCGRVLLDGQDLRDLTLEGLRRQIGVVFQDTFLFARTIRENVCLGYEDANDAQIIAALRAANAWEFIEGLPNGLDTNVGERGFQLSEGQKQRLAIARAFLRDPRILVLDEPTSALDARSETLLQAALADLTRGRTTFVIAHRLTTVQQADRVLVLSEGKVVQQGTPAELLRRPGLFRELYELHFGGDWRLRDALPPASSAYLDTMVSDGV
ncbi:MAG TPA: ABC transporter ATP-binding protein [Chloroflexota bacterium]|nr:ABC transporter ATP-binding protein [Chloroflexota bacterium]